LGGNKKNWFNGLCCYVLILAFSLGLSFNLDCEISLYWIDLENTFIYIWIVICFVSRYSKRYDWYGLMIYDHRNGWSLFSIFVRVMILLILFFCLSFSWFWFWFWLSFCWFWFGSWCFLRISSSFWMIFWTVMSTSLILEY